MESARIPMESARPPWDNGRMEEIVRNLDAVDAVRRAAQRVIDTPGSVSLFKAFNAVYVGGTAEAARGSVNQLLKKGGARIGSQLHIYLGAFAGAQEQAEPTSSGLKQARVALQRALELAVAQHGLTAAGPTHCPWAPTVKMSLCLKAARSELSGWLKETGGDINDIGLLLQLVSSIANGDAAPAERIARLSKLARGAIAMAARDEMSATAAGMFSGSCFQRTSQILASHDRFEALIDRWFDFGIPIVAAGGETHASRGFRGMGVGYPAANLANGAPMHRLAAIKALGDSFEEMSTPGQPDYIVGAVHGLAYHAAVLLASHARSLDAPARMIASGPLAGRSAAFLFDLALDNPAPECPDDCRANIIVTSAAFVLALQGVEEAAIYLGDRRRHLDLSKIDASSRRRLGLVQARIDMRSGRKPLIDIPAATRGLVLAGKSKSANMIDGEYRRFCSNMAG